MDTLLTLKFLEGLKSRKTHDAHNKEPRCDPCEGGFDPRDEINGLEAKSRSRADNEG
ncbi:hypothetical protein Tco_1581574, partial [Tanacetum coccineum]